MKTILIIFLAMALVAAAFFTRPGRRDLVLFLLERQSGSSWSHGDLDRVDQQAKDVMIHDYYLWVDAEQNGKVIFTGAFAHWLPRGQQLDKSIPSAEQLAKLIGH